MGLLWFIVGLLVIAVSAMGLVLYRHSKRQQEITARNEAFRAAIVGAEAEFERAALANGTHVPSPDMRIAEKKIIRFKEQFASGKARPE